MTLEDLVRRLKMTVGLVIAAGVLLAQATSALAVEFDAQTEWSGKGEHQIVTIGTLKGECKKLSIEGRTPKNGVGHFILIQPKYSECHVETGVLKEEAMTVNTHECVYEVYDLQGKSSAFTTNSFLACGEKDVTMKLSGGCEITVIGQMTNEGGEGRDLKTEKGAFESEASSNLASFKYTVNKVCEAIGVGAGKGASFKGPTIFKGLIVVAPSIVVKPTEVRANGRLL
jgi:hypothetical protein